MRQTRTNNVASGMGNGAEDPGPEDEDPTLDYNDPTALGGLNGVSHDRQHVYINPQDLRDHPPPPPPPQQVQAPGPAGPMRQPTMPPPPPPTQPTLGTPHTQHGQPHMTPGSASPADGSMFTFAMQDMLSRCLHVLNLQTKIAQERLEIMRRREARELTEWNTRKDSVDKTAITKDKINRAFVCFSLFPELEF